VYYEGEFDDEGRFSGRGTWVSVAGSTVESFAGEFHAGERMCGVLRIPTVGVYVGRFDRAGGTTLLRDPSVHASRWEAVELSADFWGRDYRTLSPPSKHASWTWHSDDRALTLQCGWWANACHFFGSDVAPGLCAPLVACRGHACGLWSIARLAVAALYLLPLLLSLFVLCCQDRQGRFVKLIDLADKELEKVVKAAALPWGLSWPLRPLLLRALSLLFGALRKLCGPASKAVEEDQLRRVEVC